MGLCSEPFVQTYVLRKQNLHSNVYPGKWVSPSACCVREAGWVWLLSLVRCWQVDLGLPAFAHFLGGHSPPHMNIVNVLKTPASKKMRERERETDELNSWNRLHAAQDKISLTIERDNY